MHRVEAHKLVGLTQHEFGFIALHELHRVAPTGDAYDAT